MTEELGVEGFFLISLFKIFTDHKASYNLWLHRNPLTEQ